MPRHAGIQMDAVVISLLDAANDKDEEVRNAICISLQALGVRKTEIVLAECSLYLLKHSKIPVTHRILILKSIHKICVDVLVAVPHDLANQLIKQAAEEMTASKEVVPDWQNAASNILVALGAKHCHDVMETILTYFQPGVVPHFFIMQTLANLASANAYGIVPFLKALLGTLLPMLGMMRVDNMKWVTSFALAKFSEAIVEYVANIDKAPDPTVKIEVFAVEISMAFDILLTWLPTKEPKLRTSVVEAIGNMTFLLPKEKLEEQLPRLISTILNLLKRHPEVYSYSQSLHMIMEISVKHHCDALNSQVDQIIQILFPQACTLPDYMKPSTVKNHNEVLRCFCLLAQIYPDPVIQLLLTSMDNNTEKIRVGSLTVLRHIINTSGAQIAERKLLLFSGLKNVLLENNNKVKKVVAHLIVALAHHGYLQDEIGPDLIEFLVRQCALTTPGTKNKANMLDEDSDEALQASCENILYLLTTTVPDIEKVLWPHLLSYLLPEKYINAVPSLSKNIAHLANKLREENSSRLDVDYSKYPNFPSSYEILARLIVLLGCYPCGDLNYVNNLLQLLKAIAPVINKDISPLWDVEIPQLMKCVADKPKYDIKMWHKSILDFLMKTLDEVDQEKWAKHLCSSLTNHLQSYSTPRLKGFCIKCIGVSLKKVSSNDFVNHHLDKIFNSTHHIEEIERKDCAEAFGRTSVSHLDIVLAKLDNLKKSEVNRRPSGIFSFFMDSKVDANEDLAKATVILCYGSVSRFASASLLISRLENPILAHILPCFQQAKDIEMKHSLLLAVDELAQAMHSNRMTESVHFVSRKDLLNNIQNILKEETMPHPSQTRILALNCMTSLIKLNPPLLGPEKEIYLKNCLDSVYVLSDEDVDKIRQQLETSLNSLNCLLTAMLLADLTPDNLFLIISNLEGWLQSTRAHERIRSSDAILLMLRLFLENVSIGLGKPLTFGPLGAIVARLIPRCTDTILSVRQAALECIYITFQISAVYEGQGRNYSDANLQQLWTIRNKIVTENPGDLYSLTKDIGQVLALKLPVHQVAPFLHVMYEGLLDNMPSSSCGVCVVFNSVIKDRGGELHQQVEVLMKLYLHRMGLITCSATKKALLQVLRTLAGHHLMTVTSFLLNSCCEENSVIDCWHALAQEPTLGSNILEYLLDLFDRVPSVAEHPDPRNNKKTVYIANSQILSAVLAMKEIFHQAEMEETCWRLSPRICASLILLYGSFAGTYAASSSPDTQKGKGLWPPLIILEKKMDKISPTRSVVEALQAFFLCSKQEFMLQEITEDKHWMSTESLENIVEFISLLARCLCNHAPRFLASIVSHLNPSTTSVLASHRIVVAAFFAELINQRCCGDSALLELLLNSLVNSLIDNSHMVRRLSIRGLGCLGKVGADQVHKYSTTVLSAMLSGLDDKDDPTGDITLEAMSGLSKVLAEIDSSLVNPVLISIILRIRPCFENTRPDIRSASFILFGDLAKFGKTEDDSPFVEQVHNNLITLLLHLHDENNDVIKSCKHALRLVGPLLQSEAMNDMFQKHLRDDAILYYEEFMNDLVKPMVIDLPDKIPLYVSTISVYFKSSWPVIQGNAAMLIGYLIGSLPLESQENIAKDSICTALMVLLKSPMKEVRIKAAESMSAFYIP